MARRRRGPRRDAVGGRDRRHAGVHERGAAHRPPALRVRDIRVLPDDRISHATPVGIPRAVQGVAGNRVPPRAVRTRLADRTIRRGTRRRAERDGRCGVRRVPTAHGRGARVGLQQGRALRRIRHASRRPSQTPRRRPRRRTG